MCLFSLLYSQYYQKYPRNFIAHISLQTSDMKLTEAFLSVLSLLALAAKAAPLPPEDGCALIDGELWCDENLGGGSSGPEGILCHSSNCARLVRVVGTTESVEFANMRIV